ncbi:MAG TPA: hypothetical protein VFA26_17210 [Gemmataceae bacterium]|nr:hypothetical protein [Gemmataceae bacterium]
MSGLPHLAAAAGPPRWAAAVLLLFLALPPAHAAGPAAPRPGSAAPGAGPPAAAAQVSPVVAGWSFEKAWATLESFLGSRRRLFQFATVGMCIALFILFRARG